MTSPPSEPSRPGFFRLGVADFLFGFFALAILQRAAFGMVDDPGLGWQLRIPDAMLEKGGFVYTDPFGRPTQGEPWTPYGFLGSTALRLAWGWGGSAGCWCWAPAASWRHSSTPTARGCTSRSCARRTTRS